MLTFVRSEETFWGFGEVYVKLLPDGEPVQLTHDGARKVGPAFFSPDGSRVTYSVSDGSTWDTWTAPVLGGKPSRLLAAAQGLTWIPSSEGPPRILFSEFITPIPHMRVLTASESRSDPRTNMCPRTSSAWFIACIFRPTASGPC